MTKSFSLIELLVVIAIISLISSISFSNYNAAREKSRDTKRKSDLKEIQKAMELYRQNQSIPAFPTPIGNPSYLSVTNQRWEDNQNGFIYMKKVPADPLSQTVPTPYYYKSPRIANDKRTFLLCACLENKADIEGENCDLEPKCDGLICGTNKCFKIIEP